MEGFENNEISVKLFTLCKILDNFKDMFLQLSWFKKH